jgi:hypothetical protein
MHTGTSSPCSGNLSQFSKLDFWKSKRTQHHHHHQIQYTLSFFIFYTWIPLVCSVIGSSASFCVIIFITTIIQMWILAANVLNKQSQETDTRWSSNLMVEREMTNSYKMRRRIRWRRNDARMGEMWNSRRILVKKPDEKRLITRCEHRWKDNIKISIKNKVMTMWTGFVWLVGSREGHIGNEPSGSINGKGLFG